jgi:hypothetical protein
VALCAAREHAEHLVSHLEWSERGRSNHYIANLVGLLWSASHLPPDTRVNAMLAFAAKDLLAESDRQFLSDGGNYEGSTNYHRLSGELVLFGVSVLAGLSEEELARIDGAKDVLGLRVPWQPGPLPRYPLSQSGATIVPPPLCDKLRRAGVFARWITRPDGRVVQIGDTDSGRLFKLTPSDRHSDEGLEAPAAEDDALDHSAFAAGVTELFGGKSDVPAIEAALVRRLAGRSFTVGDAAAVPDHGDLDSIIRTIDALPDGCRRRRRIVTAQLTWQRAAFPDFGLYIFRADRAFIAFRCAPKPPADAPLGHTHDDNLSLDYMLEDEVWTDPGSFCYTPSRALRNRYRDARAHNVVRAKGFEVAPPGRELFHLAHAGWAQCLAWRPEGVAGELVTPQGHLWRALRLDATGIEIVDGVSPPHQLRDIATPIPVASGYGRLAADWMQ